MTEPTLSPISPPRRGQTGRKAAAALVAVAALGGIALYGTGLVSSNPNEAQCRAARPVAAGLKPLAKGDVAAFLPADAPAPLPPVTFIGPDGRPTSLADLKGRAVLLNLWATWCAPCREEMPALDRLQARMGGDDFEVVAVNIDLRNLDKPKAWLKERGIAALGYYSDPSAKVFQDMKAAGKAFGMPTTFLIDKDGCELGAISGAADWGGEDAGKLIAAALRRAP